MKASIIVPVYNTELYLRQCVESVLRQDISDIELILVDDGSTDNSPEICDQLSAENDQIHVIHQHNQGSSAARNTGIDHARGDIILFLDSDDYWKTEDALNCILQTFEKTSCDMVEFSCCKFWDGSQKMLVETHPEAYVTWNNEEEKNRQLIHLLHQGALTACAWNKAIRRKLFADGQLRFRVGMTAEDIDWAARLLISARSIVCLRKPVVAYRKRPMSITMNMDPNKFSQLLDNLYYINDNWKDYPYITHFMSIAVCNAILSMSRLSTDAQKHFSDQVSHLAPYLRYGATRRVRLVRKAISVFGLMGTCLIAKYVRKLNEHS